MRRGFASPGSPSDNVRAAELRPSIDSGAWTTLANLRRLTFVKRTILLASAYPRGCSLLECTHPRRGSFAMT
jgi:hypothetical protein